MACTRCQLSPTMRATAANGICWASSNTSASNSKVKPAGLPTQSGSVSAPLPARPPKAGHADFEMAFMLEEVEVAQPLDLGIVDRVLARRLGVGKAAARRKIDVDGEPALPGVEVDRLHEPGRGDAQCCRKQ